MELVKQISIELALFQPLQDGTIVQVKIDVSDRRDRKARRPKQSMPDHEIVAFVRFENRGHAVKLTKARELPLETVPAGAPIVPAAVISHLDVVDDSIPNHHRWLG